MLTFWQNSLFNEQKFYLVKDENQLVVFRDFVAKNAAKLQDYLVFLKDEFAVYDLPQAIIWSDFDSATQIIREIPVPAYTNDRRMVMTPELTVWKDLYLLQLENYETSHKTQAIANHIEDRKSVV